MFLGCKDEVFKAEGSSALPLVVVVAAEASRLCTADAGVLLETKRSGGDARLWCDTGLESSGMSGIGVVDWTGPVLIKGWEAILIKIIRGSAVSILSVFGTLEAVLSRQRSAHCPKPTLVGVDLKDTIESHIVAQQSMADSIKEGLLMLGRECIRFESNEECENPLGRDDEGGWLLFLKGDRKRGGEEVEARGSSSSGEVRERHFVWILRIISIK